MNLLIINLLYFTLYIIISSYGLIKLKVADTYFSIDFAIGSMCYGFGFIIWIYILRNVDLSVSFPIAAGGLIIATQFLSYKILGETITSNKLVGSVLIIAGISVIFGGTNE